MFGIKLAPLNIPLERRLQTLGTLTYISITFFSEICGTILYFYIIFYTRFWVLGLMYGLHIILERDRCNTGGQSSPAVRGWFMWKHLRDYFPLKLIRTVELDPNRNYMFCVFPHGILGTGVTVGIGTDAAGWPKLFPGITPNFLSLTYHFLVPFSREFVLRLGMCSASAKSINYILDPARKGRAAVLVIGGAAEAMHSSPGSYKIILKKRKGFIKLALKNGAPLVPTFSFGETDLYNQIDFPDGSMMKRFQTWIKATSGIAPLLVNGRGIFQYSFGLLPRRRPINIVVGAPFEVKQISNPTNEEIDNTHSEFTERLITLFNEHKHKYVKNHETVNLVIV